MVVMLVADGNGDTFILALAFSVLSALYHPLFLNCHFAKPRIS
jgi:hypothetical protein